MSDAPPPAAAPTIRRFLFFDERRPTRAWMPTLHTINERFADYSRVALLQSLQPPVEVTPEFAIEVIKHSELTDRLAGPAHLTLASVRPLYGAILIAVSAELVGLIVESRFGGGGRLPLVALPDREFAPLEHRSICRVVEQLLGQLALAWKPIVALTPQIVRHEMKAALAAIANPTDLVIVNSFGVTVARGGGKLTIAIPYLMLEPLHERLAATGTTKRDKSDKADPGWSEELQTGIGDATTELNVELAGIEMTIGDFLNLRPGSVFEIARPDSVTVQSQGLPLFRGRWGRHGRKIAVRVEELLTPGGDAPRAAEPRRKGGGPDDAG
jgi:flagellar motor switch protein FliM